MPGADDATRMPGAQNPVDCFMFFFATDVKRTFFERAQGATIRSREAMLPGQGCCVRGVPELL